MQALGVKNIARLGGAAGTALPALDAQTLLLDLNGSIGAGTFVRASNAWNPESGDIAPHNVFLNSATGVTQSITLTAVPQVLSFKGTGSITLSGTATGSLAGTGAADRVSLAFTPTAGSVTFTVAGSCTEVQINQYQLTDYVPTTSSAIYRPRYVSGKSGQGYLPEETSTNKCTCWSVPKDSDAVGVKLTGSGTFNGMTLSGDAAATLSVVDDSAALEAAGLSNWCNSGKVYKLDNSAGAALSFVSISGSTGNTNNHSVSLTAKGTGRLYIDSAFTAITGSAYTRFKLENTPSTATFRVVTIRAEIGSIVYFILPQLEELPYATSPILCAGVATARAADVLTHPASGYLTAAQGTISCWVKVNTAIQSDTNFHFMFYEETALNVNQIAMYKTNVANRWFLTTRNAAGTASTINVLNALSDGWHMFTAVWGGSFPLLYIDGVLAGTAASNNIPSAVATNMYIGSSNTGVSQVDMPIDQLRIYNRVLTQDEITRLYRSGR